MTGSNPFSDPSYGLDPDEKPAANPFGDPEYGKELGVAGTLWEGTKSAGRAIGATVDAYTGDNQGIVDKAAAQQAAPKDPRVEKFYQDFAQRTEALGEDPGVLDTIGEGLGAVWDNPAGAGLATVEQLPNAVPTLAGGYAGLKAGAAAGAVAGAPFAVVGAGPGAAIGGVVGGIAGMFLGNAAIETGHKAMGMADDGEVTDEERGQAIEEGAVKGAVITGVDAFTLGLGGKVASTLNRTATTAVETATRKALLDRGVDVADEAAVLAAKSNPETFAAVRAAQENAIKATDTLKRKAAQGGTLFAMETVGEGVGEYLGEMAATGEGSVPDAVMESLLSAGQSGVETAWNMSRKSPNSAKWVQPTPSAENPNPAPVQRPDPSAGPLSAAASKLPAPAPVLDTDQIQKVAGITPLPVLDTAALERNLGPLAASAEKHTDSFGIGRRAPMEPTTAQQSPPVLDTAQIEQATGLSATPEQLPPEQQRIDLAGESVQNLRADLDFIESQGKRNGWTPALTAKRARLRGELDKAEQAMQVQQPAAEPASQPSSVVGESIDGNWHRFAPEAGGVGVPREQMPQIKAEHRGAMVNFLNARGVQHEEQSVPAASLKPAQAEFSREKVERAKGFTGGNRAILTSADGYVVDGHHQWMAALENGEDVRTIRLDAPIRDLLPLVAELPSATQDKSSAEVPAAEMAKPAAAEQPGAEKSEQAQRNPVDYLREIVRQSSVSQADTVGAARAAILNPDASEVERQALLEEVGAADAKSTAELDAALVKWWRRHFRARAEHKAKGKTAIEAFDQQRRDQEVESTLDMGRQAAAEMDAQAFISAPDGSLDFGEITGDMAKAAGRQAGKIRLQQGNESWGLQHIEQRHGAEIRDAGFADVPAFVADIAQHIDQVWKPAATRQLVALHKVGNNRMMFVELQPGKDEAGDFYTVNTAFTSRKAEKKGWKLLWEARAQASGESGNRPSFAVSPPVAGGEVTNPSSQSSEPSIAPPAGDKPAAKPKSKPAAKPDAKLEDAGEKLGGARKDELRSVRERLDDMDDAAIAGSSLSQLWPKGELDKISEPFEAALYHVVRGLIPAKPRVPYRVKGWVAKVKAGREILTKLGAIGADASAEKMRAFSPDLGIVADQIEVLMALDRKHWGRVDSVRRAHGRYNQDGEMVPGSWVSLNIDGRSVSFFGHETVASAIPAIKEQVEGKSAPEKRMKFAVYSDRQTGDVFVVKDGDAEMRRLKTFKTVKEARAFLNDEYEAAVALWDAVKNRDNVTKSDMRRAANDPRVGQNHRDGKDVTPEQFIEAFGFRGVEFGNWVKQGAGGRERQGMLNDAYDAFMDLAGILNIPPKALSLEGKLGIGFGSRGSGKASAHYEPDLVVINMTKTKGAGALAHEWFHALDNYFARRRAEQPGSNIAMKDRETAYITYRPERMWVNKKYPSMQMPRAELTRYQGNHPDAPLYQESNWEPDANHPNGVRPQVEKAFAELVATLNASPMLQRAKVIDGKTSDGYWSRIIERGARSFETYVIARLADQGFRNDYLANVQTLEQFSRDPGRYPYLTPDEQGPVNEAFDKLFATLETKETDLGVALFSRAGGPIDPAGLSESSIVTGKAPENPISLEEAISAAEQFLADYNGNIELSYRIRKTQYELYGPAGAVSEIGVVKGAYHPGRGIFTLTADHLSSATDAVETLRHEVLGHYGLDTFSPADKQAVLDKILASKDEPSLKPVWDDIAVRYKDKSQNVQAEEVFAFLAQGERSGKEKLADLLYSLLTRLLRKVLGYKKGIITRSELLREIEVISKGIRNGSRQRQTFESETKQRRGAQTETPAFKRWFGDSKVVDAEGKPLVVYHGTKSDVATFDAKKAGATDPGLVGKGFYFTPGAEQAGDFATARHYGKGEAPNVMPVYLSLQNPAVIEDGVLPDGSSMMSRHPQGITKQSAADIKKALLRDGYDGAIFKMDGEISQVVVFRPEQIKSAIGNNGDFDPSNPDIRYNLAQAATKGIPLFSARAIAKKVMAATGLNATVVNNESELPADLQAQIRRDKATGRVAGVYHNGTAYLVAANLRDTQHAISVMLHEAIGHGGVKSVLGDRIGKVMAEIYRDMPAAMRKELERRYAGQMASMSEADARVMIAEEYVAHLAETDPRHSIINRLVALLRQFIRDTFGKSAALKWTRNDLVLLLAEARTAARNGGRGPGGAARMRETAAADALAALPEVDAADESAFVASLKGDAATRSFASALYKARGTESPFFKAWFGKSRMADKQGQPIAFVHRSYGERDTFSDADLGKNTGTPTATLGHFLARKDVSNVERYGPVVEQFYIRMEKPKVITQAQFEAMGDWSLAKVQAYRKTLMEQGHDGLYIQGLAWPVVFEGKNIKAKRNQGTFDATASTRYSLAQTVTAAFKRWFGDSKVVDAEGKPLVVYHGTPSPSFDAFSLDKAGSNLDSGFLGAGFYFTTDADLARYYATSGRSDSPAIMPVYAAIKNPFMWGVKTAGVRGEVLNGDGLPASIKKSVLERAGFKYDPKAEPDFTNEPKLSRALREELIVRGYDGVIADYKSGGREIVAFFPEQIKSAIGNSGDFDPSNPDIRYSLNDEADTTEALRKLGLGGRDADGIIEQIRNMTLGGLKAKLGEWSTRSEEGIFDGLAGIKRAEEAVGVTDADSQGYVSARMATGIADVMHGVLHYAAPEWRDGVISGKADTRGVLEILGDLGQDNLTPWLAWLGGKRAQMLKAQGRENNLTDADIAELLAMGQGKEELFEKVYRDYAKTNEAVLDLAEGAGLIDKEARAKWATEYYVPFYRQDEAEGIFTAPRTKRGLSHQSAAIKALKGGTLPTNDLLTNMLTGWTKRIDAAMKNKALLEVVDNLQGSEFLSDESPRFQQVLISRSQIAQQIRKDRKALAMAADMLGLPEGSKFLKVANQLMKPENEGFEKLWTKVAPTDPDIIRVQRGGKNEYYRVNDESLLRGLKFMEGSVFNDPITRIGRTFKRLLTTGVTASPDFILRNFIRDAAHAWMINKDGFVLGKDSIKGMRDALREDQDYRDLMFAGGSFQGGYVHGTDPEASAQIIRRALEKKGFSKQQQDSYLGSLVNTPAKAAAMLGRGWQSYRTLGDKVENANRLSTYKAALAAGKSKRQAAFEAKDLMDYSLRGNFAAAQWFTDVVPFLNARLQGLYKLGRAMKDDKTVIAKEVALKGAYIALFSLLLAGINDDDERYQELMDWDKDMHWHIFLGDQHFRIPKPFELGLIFGTVPERLLHALTGTQDGGDLAKAVSNGVFQTLAFNPVPQFYQPIRELQANRNFFRDMPIEDMSDEGKLPEARFDERTSAIGRALGQVTGPTLGISPKQLDHLVQGYTGTLGGYVLGMSNLVAGVFDDAARPSARAGDLPVVKVLYQGDDVRSTKYQSQFYDMMREADQLHRTVKSYREEGRVDAAERLLESSRDKLKHRAALGISRQQLGAVRKQMDAVYRDTSMSGEAKRARLDQLQVRANQIAERIVRRAEGDF